MTETTFATVPQHLATRTHEAMRPVLRDPEAEGPAVHYYMIRGGRERRNVTVWEPGTVGGEYIKTFGHYHADDLPETYWVVSGEGVAVLQRINPDNPTVIDELRVVQATAGDRLDIPTRFGHLMVNTGDGFLVTTDDSPVDFGDADPSGHPGHADYSEVERMRGLGYYVIEHDGQPALVRNPQYSEIKSETLDGLPVVTP